MVRGIYFYICKAPPSLNCQADVDNRDHDDVCLHRLGHGFKRRHHVAGGIMKNSLTWPHKNSRYSLNFGPILKSKGVLETTEQALGDARGILQLAMS